MANLTVVHYISRGGGVLVLIIVYRGITRSSIRQITTVALITVHLIASTSSPFNVLGSGGGCVVVRSQHVLSWVITQVVRRSVKDSGFWFVACTSGNVIEVSVLVLSWLKAVVLIEIGLLVGRMLWVDR